MRPLLARTVCCALLAGAGVARAVEPVTIYRCVDARGGVALQDQPCPKDTRQQIRQMVRPLDAAPRPEEPDDGAPPPRLAQVVRVVHERAPRPMYECRTPDGQTYPSDTGVPNGRYVPLWTYAYDNGIGVRGGRTGSRPQPSSQPSISPAMTWQQDSCVRLSPNDACERLRDQRDALGDRIFNAQGSDRDLLERQQKGVDEQLQSDCSN